MIDQKPEVVKYLYEFAKNPKGIIVIMGKNGRGKTYAARAVYNYVSPYKPPHYDRDIAIMLKQSELNLQLSQDPTHGLKLTAELSHTKLLIIDDLGTREPSPALLDILFTIFDNRYEDRENKGTIITTNLMPDQLRDKFGDAILSRTASAGKCFLFESAYDRRSLHYNGYTSSQNKKVMATHQ